MTTILTSVPLQGNENPIPLTNSGRNPPNFGVAQPLVGVDTVRFGGRARRHGLAKNTTHFRLDPSSGEVRQVRSLSSEILEVAGRPVRIHADDDQGRVDFEMSVPKWTRDTNEMAATAAEVFDAALEVFEATNQLIDWTDEWTDFEVARLDLVRTFEGVHDISGTLARLATVPIRRTARREYFTNPYLGDAQTLTVQVSGRWRAMAYDKAAEMISAARRKSTTGADAEVLRTRAAVLKRRGHLRTEICLRSRVLRETFPTRRLVDILQEDRMTETARHYFHAAGFHQSVGGRPKVLRALTLMDDQDVSRTQRAGVVHMLVEESLGLTPTASPNSLDTYRAIARRFDISSADFNLEHGAEIRLDWSQGLQMETGA